MAEKSIWYQTKIRNPHQVLYGQETRKNQGMMPNFANELTLAGHSFFTKIDILYLKHPHIPWTGNGTVLTDRQTN